MSQKQELIAKLIPLLKEKKKDIRKKVILGIKKPPILLSFFIFNIQITAKMSILSF